MRNRIIGLETEYAIKYYPVANVEQSKYVLSERELFDILSSILEKREFERLYKDPKYKRRYKNLFGDDFELEVPLINKPMMFMSNGSRFYMDTGFHPEYATPECKDAYNILIYDRAGESLLEDLLFLTEMKLNKQGYKGEVFICKNNIDINGNTYGCHENYLVLRRVKNYNEERFFKYLVENLIPFLITRQIFAGTGKFLSGDQLKFQISQRADYINSEVSSTTTSNRGIINSRDETLGDSERYRRLHIILGDSNMADIPTFLKIGTTNIVLRMIEDLFLDDKFSMESPVAFLKQISCDLDFSQKIPLKNGQRMTALDIQFEYLRSAREYFESDGVRFATIELEILNLWEEVLNDIRYNRAALRKKLDWAAKKWIMDRFLKKAGVDFEELAKWSYIINTIKKRNLEGRIFSKAEKSTSFDLKSFLKENMLEMEYNHLKMYLRDYRISLENYFLMHSLYHKVLERDIKYHDIRKEKGLFFLLQKNGLMKSLLTDADMKRVIKAKTSPPKNTRAKLRADFIHFVNRFGIKGEANWDSLTIIQEEKKVIDISSPYKTFNRRFDEFKRSGNL